MNKVEEKMDKELEQDDPLTPQEEKMLRDMLALPFRTRFRDLQNEDTIGKCPQSITAGGIMN